MVASNATDRPEERPNQVLIPLDADEAMLALRRFHRSGESQRGSHAGGEAPAHEQ